MEALPRGRSARTSEPFGNLPSLLFVFKSSYVWGLQSSMWKLDAKVQTVDSADLQMLQTSSPQLLWIGDGETNDTENTRTYMVEERTNFCDMSSTLHVHAERMYTHTYTHAK